MEDEIKVNEYVRLKNGIIGTILEIKTVSTNMRGEHAYAYKLGKTKKYNSCWVEDYAIVKHSPNPIDIIEENDIGIMNCYGLIVKKCLTMDDILRLKTKEYELLEIVTKEQFESISYKVERKD